MKFGKEYAAQMVPEWQEAYMNYNHLKKILKEIHVLNQASRPPPGSITRQKTLYRAFSGLLKHRDTDHRAEQPQLELADVESQAILVSSVKRNGSENFRYHTTCLTPDQQEVEFFRSLDEEFNKVDKFYKSKVDEVVQEARELNKQMDAFIAFRIKVDTPSVFFDPKAEMDRLASDVAASAAALAASTPHVARASASRRVHKRMESINEAQSVHGQSGLVSDHTDHRESGTHGDPGLRPHPMEILSNVKLQDHLDSPLSAIKAFLKVPKNTELSFTTENLKRVEDNLKMAFAEFYRKLCLLKKYSFLNIEAFSKIMKKYDKITSKDAAKAYMKMVDRSYLGSSEEVVKLMERVEATFIKHFTNSNVSQGMRVLRPKTRREKHRITFSTGFFAGCTAALVFALILLVRVRDIVKQPGASQYMDTLFPLYSFFGFIVLHMLMYAGNIFFWRKYRVNYSFIFGFKQGTELSYGDVLLLSFGLAVAALACVLANLDMEMDPRTNDYRALTELLPLNLLFLMIIIVFCPFNIIYRSSRFFFLRTLFRALLAPFFKVTLPDFLVADQLCSQVQALRSLEFYICYYGWGDYKKRRNTCKSHDAFNIFYFIVAGFPFWLRFCQCVRRLVEEKDTLQAWNALKYFLAIVAVCVRTAYSLNKDSVAWKVVAWFFLIGVGIFVAYWDLVYDWGVLNRKSKNRWLKDKLLLPYKSVYYVAIVLNVVLRLAWVETVLDLNRFSLHSNAYSMIVASLEIFRRGVWNFFRLEHEQLSNIGNFRAFKSVPLPFNYDVDDKDESVD